MAAIWSISEMMLSSGICQPSTHWNAGDRSYDRFIYTLKVPALPAENMHVLIMHWCASWCSRRAISPSGFVLELGFPVFFFPMEVHATVSHPCWPSLSVAFIRDSGTWQAGKNHSTQTESHHKATMPTQSLQFADSSVLAVQTSDTEHYVVLFEK